VKPVNSVTRAGSGVVRIDPLRFLVGCCKRRLNQAVLFTSATLVFTSNHQKTEHMQVQSDVKLSVLAKWLARKTPLSKPSRGEGIISIKPRPKSAHDFLGLLYCFIVLLCICVVSCPYMIYYPTVMAQYSLFVLKVPLNPKQTIKQTIISTKPRPISVNDFRFIVCFIVNPLPRWGIKRWCCLTPVCLTSVCLSVTSGPSRELKGLRKLKLAQR